MVLFPFAAHAIQVILCVVMTYLCSRKKEHPDYATVALLGFVGWGAFLAVKYHERRRIARQSRLDAVTTAGNLALRDRFSTPQNNNNSNNNGGIVESPREPNNGTFREVNLLNDSAA